MIRWSFHISRFVLIAIALWLFASTSFSQNVFSSEDDMKKQANKLFDDEEYTKAYPLFSQLLSLYPKDAQYNYKFGTCLLFAGNDKGKAIPYIEYAAKRQKQGVDKEVFFFLAKAYHLNYRFADAIRLYTAYKGMASSRMVERFDVNRQIEMCENGMNLLKSVTELSVLEKKEVPVSDFFRSYNLSEFNAKIIVKPEDLKTSLDKKRKDASVMYLAPDRNQIYFSSYGEDAKNGKDIYYVTRTPGGDLSKPIRVSDVINTKYDEDFPFLHPNGKILYFCSKGHNSMGGYDIFKSEWDERSNSWGKPVNMDFAINTPDDDILFISDSEDKTAYFSSQRESAQGNISVYKIKLDRKPLDISIIKGILAKEVGDKVPNAKITVKKISSDEVVGVFNSNTSDGSYSLNLPNGGKFMFTVEAPGFKKSSELVVVPTQKEIKPLKQQIALVNENGQDKLVIRNEFESQIDSTDLAFAVQYIKAKAALDITPAEEEITAVAVEENVPATKTEMKAEAKNVTPVTNSDIIAIGYQDAKEAQKDVNEMRKNSEAAQQLANQKNELSLQKSKEATELMRSAEANTNPTEKMAQIDKATQLRKESEKLSKEAAISLTLSNQMDDQAKAKQEQADAELKYAKDMENAIKAGSNEKKMNELLAQKEKLDKRNDSLNISFPPDMNKIALAKQTEAGKSIAKYLDVQQDVEDMQSESKRLRTEAEKTKNDGVKKNLNQQADDIEKEAEAKKRNAETYFAQGKQLQTQADSIKSSAVLTSSVMKQIQSSAEKTTVLSKAEQPTETKITAVVVPETKNLPENNTATVSATTTTTIQPETSGIQPIVISSAYVDNFVKQTQEADKKEKELDREEYKAVIYQSWTDSLDNQIVSLNKQLTSTTSDENKTKIQNKISELQSSADEKRQKASDSRNKVDNLKLKEALAAASTISPETTATVKTTNPETNPVVSESPENLRGKTNIDDYYIAKLQENAKTANEYEKKLKEKELYQDWSSSLYDESQRLKKEGKGGKAEDIEKESKAKQVLAMQRADEVTQIKAEHPELVIAASVKQPVKDEKQNKTSDEITSTTKSPEIKSESKISEGAATYQPVSTATTTVSTEATTVSANTVTSTHPDVSPDTKNVTATNPATVSSSSKAESTNPPIDQPIPAISASVKNKDEYTHYTALKNESDWNRKHADWQYKQADDLQKISEQQFSESQKRSQQISTASDPNIQNELKKQADDLNKRALRNQAKADSIKKIGQNSEAEANSKRTESELYLQSLDKSVYEEIATATGYKPTAATTTAAKTESTSTASQSVVNSKITPETTTVSATNPATTEAASKETSEKTSSSKAETISKEPATTSTKTITATETEKTPVITAVNPAVTETVKTNTVSETTSVSAKTETPVQPKNTTATTSKTEGATSTEVAAHQPNSATAATQLKPSVELLKYYDALFDKLELAGATYSSSKPIPVDAPMPDGLIFKVQIGAFKNPIPQNLFKGIKPITSESTPQGFKRYTAGLFRKFETANNAKKKVNGLGYHDAFVVAFFNGKRISINEALVKAKEAGETIDLTAVNSAGEKATSESATNIANTTDVKSVNGLFYAIQIGVFSNPVSATQLYNISPLNSEKTDNGLIRYTTGRFDDEIKASKAKNTIAQKGISDAFVIAYYNGKRISLSAAKTMIDSQGKDVLSKDKQEYTFVPSDTTTSESSATAMTTSSNKGIVFKVQVGAFKEQVPIDIANKLLANSGKGIKTFKDENGLMVYTIGEFLEYESANNLKTQLINNGLSGSFIIAFKDGKKFSASEALEMIKNR